MKTSYFINSKYFGQSQSSNPFALNSLWYCVQCGEVYARMIRDKPDRGWDTIPGTCEKCISTGVFSNRIPGSIWTPYGFEQRNLELPKLVLERELELAIEDRLKQEAKNGNTSDLGNSSLDDNGRGI